MPGLYAAAFLPGWTSLALGRYLGVGDPEGALLILDATTGCLLQACPTQVAGVPTALIRLVMDPSGRHLAGGTMDGYVLVWEVPTNPDPRPVAAMVAPLPAAYPLVSALGRITLAPPRVMPATVSRVAGLTFSGDGRYLAAAGIDSALKLWDTSTWQPLPDLPGHAGAVWDLAASPDGRFLGSAGSDGTIRLWDLRNRTERQVLRGHIDTVSGVAFSPDGRRLASAGRDRTLRIGDVRSLQD